MTYISRLCLLLLFDDPRAPLDFHFIGWTTCPLHAWTSAYCSLLFSNIIILQHLCFPSDSPCFRSIASLPCTPSWHSLFLLVFPLSAAMALFHSASGSDIYRLFSLHILPVLTDQLCTRTYYPVVSHTPPLAGGRYDIYISFKRAEL